MTRLPLLLALLPAAGPAFAAKSPRLPAPARPAANTPKVRSLSVYPSVVTLGSRRASQQLVVTGATGGEPCDLTRAAEYRVDNRKVAAAELGRIAAVGDGTARVTVRYAGLVAVVPVRVAGCARPDPVRFNQEVLPVLTKQGCAGGSCHGSPHGKGGFSLSLFGYDPRIDRVSLTRDGYNRRINVLEPEESLILKKPLLQVPHVGGKRLMKSDAAYPVLRNWVYEGAKVDDPAPAGLQIKVTPGAARVLRAPFLTQQLSVQARFPDHTTRSVTDLATFASSNPSVASVDASGLVTGLERGQAAISVRYLDQLVSLNITVIKDVPGFAWSNPPENNFIDRLAHAKQRQLQYLPSGPCSDETFVRRIHLDLTGQLPTPERVKRFLAECAAERKNGGMEEGKRGSTQAPKSSTPPPLHSSLPAQSRSRLIDELLNSEEYARFWALKKADLMRVSPKRLTDGRADLFANWLVEATRKNLPYDQFARELLTASGDTEQVAAANYFLAIPSMEERTEMTAQLFMGSRLECAKCHNHPFENWTMRDYYSIAAVFARTQAGDGQVVQAATGEAIHPASKDVMTPWGMNPEQVKSQAEADRRRFFAEWLTRKGNPYFARVEVNRIWADLLGRGIVEPVDDFRSSNPPANAPLLDALAAEFEKCGYDRKHLIRLICNSRTYQASTETNRFNADDEALFTHARIRLLTAEQLKDAIGAATRALPAASEVQPRLDGLRKELEARTGALLREFPAWQAKGAEELPRQPIRFGAWYAAGPFRRGSGAFPPETGPVDLNARYPGNLGWTLRTDLRDGANNLALERPGVHYLFRRITAAQAGTVQVQLKSADPLQVWLNGTLLTPQPVQGERSINLALPAGESQLLLKVTPGQRRGAWSFVPSGVSRRFPPHVMEALSQPEAQRPPALAEALRAFYLEQDAQVRTLREQIERLDARLDYATQRPYPERTAFTTAFGQPQRDTACTCERQSSPTLLQALELLNGGSAYQMAVTGAARYSGFTDDQLIDELYLSALARSPSPKERETAKRYLLKSGNRAESITDLIWTVVNTQEFLFQH